MTTNILASQLAPPQPEKRRMTAAEYAALYTETTQRMDLLDGEVFVTASPKYAHQKVVGDTFTYLQALSRDEQIGGTAVIAPSDLYLDDYNVPQPDVFWVSAASTVCRLGEDDYWHGAPDLCIEVFSPSTARRDRIDKFQLYERVGVREYWMIDPVARTLEVWSLVDGMYTLQGNYTPLDTQFASLVLGNTIITLGEIFRI